MIVNTEKKYSPKSLDEFIFPNEEARELVTAYSSGEMERPLILYGSSGTGKSLLQRLIPNAIDQKHASLTVVKYADLKSASDIHDLYGRNKLGGVPPKKNADWAWVQHMYKSMDLKTGRIAVVLPQGALTRGAAEGRIRRNFLEKDLIEGVIGMAPNLFYGTGLAPCIIILKANKSNKRAKKVLVINAETIFRRGRNQNTLEDENVESIIDLYSNFLSIEGLAKLVTFNEIEKNDFNLNIPLYVTPNKNRQQLSLKQCLSNLDSANMQVQDSRSNLLEELQKWGLNVKR